MDTELTTETTAEDLSAEIDAAVNDVVADVEAERESAADESHGDESDPEEQKSRDAAETSADADADDDDGQGDGDSEDAVTDEHLERAVKAGLTMAEARQFSSGALLDAMITRISQSSGAAGDDGAHNDEDGEIDSDDDSPLAEIPDLDPNEYDDKIVAAVGAMKKIIQQQQKELRSLHESSGGEVDWIKAQVSDMDDSVAKIVKSDPVKLDAVRKKFAVLEAGYTSSGEKIGREAILQEAVNIALGSDIAKAKASTTAEELKKRRSQHIRRPAGNRGTTPKGDPTAEVADDIDKKYFSKTG